jgi:hypothetical protein
LVTKPNLADRTGLRVSSFLLTLLAIVVGCPAWLLAQTPNSSSSAALYRTLRESGLDTTKVYRVRDATFDREDLHFALNDGWLIFGKR